MKKLDLYGCGTYGIYAVDSDFKGRKLKIHHCSDGAMWCMDTTSELKDVKVYNNTYHKKGINNKNEKEILWWDNQQLK